VPVARAVIGRWDALRPFTTSALELGNKIRRVAGHRRNLSDIQAGAQTVDHS
jgi:hypothetical protein